MSLRLKNPHSILATLEARPQDVTQVFLPPGGPQAGPTWERIAQLARSRKIPVANASGGKSQNRSEEGGRAQSGEAVVQEKSGITAEELFAKAPERAGGKGLWLALDCLQDPHNVGAIFRAAAFFGVQGIMVTQERSAPISGTVYDVATGGLECVPFTLQTNLQRGFEVAKENGLWILGTSEHNGDDIASITRDRPWLLVLGNEEKGMRRLTEESCDLHCKIAAKGKVTSLNVSVAAGIFISRLSTF